MTRRLDTDLAWNAGSPSLVALGRFLSMGFALVTVPIVARAIGPTGRGVTASMLAVLLTATVALGLGVPLAMRRRVAEGEKLGTVVAAGRTFALCTIVPSAIFGFVCNALFYSAEPMESQIAFLVSFTLIPLSVSWGQDVSVLVAQRNFTKMAILGLLQAGATLVILLVLYVLGGVSVAAVIYANLAGNIVTFLTGLTWVRAGIGELRYARGLTREGLSLVGAQLADAATKKVDQIIALPLLGAQGAGFYSVAATVASLSAPVAQALAAGMYTRMVGPTGRSAEFAPLSVRYSIAVGLPTALALVVVAWVGVPILFGAEFAGAVVPSMIMAASAPALITSYVCANWLAAQQRGRRLTVVQLCSLAAMVVMLLAGGFSWATTGAAVSVMLAAYVGAVLTARAVSPRFRSWVPRRSDFGGAIQTLVRHS